jgi:VanZ family protein
MNFGGQPLLGGIGLASGIVSYPKWGMLRRRGHAGRRRRHPTREWSAILHALPSKEGLRMIRPWRHEPSVVRLSRTIGLACLVVLMVLSLLPADQRPHTGSPGQLEHFVAYFGTAVFLALGFRTMRDRVAMISLLVGLAAVLEVIQRLIPGRHSQFIDWFASSFGAGCGILAVVLMERLLLSAE